MIAQDPFVADQSNRLCRHLWDRVLMG
jgi:hypothetical protein